MIRARDCGKHGGKWVRAIHRLPRLESLLNREVLGGVGGSGGTVSFFVTAEVRHIQFFSFLAGANLLNGEVKKRG